MENASKVVASPTAEQSAPAGKEAKNKDPPAPSKECAPQPGKDEKQASILGTGDLSLPKRWWILLLPGMG